MKKDLAVLSDQITSALNDFAEQASKQAKRNYKDARSNMDGFMSDWQRRGADAAEHAYDTAYDMASTLEEKLEDTITSRPLATLGVAIALGFVIGAAWRK